MGYFCFCLNERINIINVEKAIANINDSETVIGIPPGPYDAGHADIVTGCGELSLPSFSMPTTLELPILLNYIIAHIRSLKLDVK